MQKIYIYIAFILLGLLIMPVTALLGSDLLAPPQMESIFNDGLIAKDPDEKVRIADNKGRFVYNGYRYSLNSTFAGLHLRIIPINHPDWNKGFKVYHGETLIALNDGKSDNMSLIYIKRMTEDRGRFIVDKKRFKLGAQYGNKEIILFPLYGDWENGFEVFIGEQIIARYLKLSDRFNLLFRVKKTDEKGRFVLDGTRYNLGAANAEREVVLYPCCGDWASGFCAFSSDNEIIRFVSAKSVRARSLACIRRFIQTSS